MNLKLLELGEVKNYEYIRIHNNLKEKNEQENQQ